MKLASLKSGRDGRLVIVSRDLTRAVLASSIAPTMQSALDDWPAIAPALAARAEKLEAGVLATLPFREDACAAPFPRAYRWVDGSAYVNHVALVRKARGAEMPAFFWTDPLMYQGGSDVFLGPRDPIPLPGGESLGLDLEAEVAVVTDDVPMGVMPDAARAHIRLVMLANDVTSRGLVASELAKGFGFLQSKPPTAFSPVAVTPDELGPAWNGGRLHLPLLSFVNGAPLGRPNAGVDMTFDFGVLIAHAARTRPLSRRLHHRVRHGFEPRRGRRAGQTDFRGRRGLLLPGGAARRRNTASWGSANAVSQSWRHRSHRNARCRGRFDLRRARPDGHVAALSAFPFARK